MMMEKSSFFVGFVEAPFVSDPVRRCLIPSPEPATEIARKLHVRKECVEQYFLNACDKYSIFLINHAGILENLRFNMGKKSVLNGIFDPFRALGSVRNGFAVHFSSRLSPSKLRTASKWSPNPFVSP